MTRTTITKFGRTGGIAALALTMSLGLAACGSDSESDNASDTTSSDSSPSESASSEATGAAAETFGDGCSAVPESGDGSFEGMAQDPVATAASNNPVLSTLVSAVTEAGLVDTLNSAENLTVFAPTNDAFAKIDKADLDALLADKEQLTAVLTHHVVGERLAPDAVAGTHETLNKDDVVVEGNADEGVTIPADDSTVVCGNVQTANATVYIVDTVLMPPAA